MQLICDSIKLFHMYAKDYNMVESGLWTASELSKTCVLLLTVESVRLVFCYEYYLLEL